MFCRDHGEDIARRLCVGMAGINETLVFSMNPALPFGGRDDSGYGCKHGEEGLREFPYPHSFSAKTGPLRRRRRTSTGRPGRWRLLLPPFARDLAPVWDTAGD